MAVLLQPELAIGEAAIDQLLMRPDIDDLALLHDQDLIAIDQGGEAVGDDDHGPPAGDAQQVGIDHRFALRIEGAGGLVEDQDARIVDERPRNGEALALAAGEIGRALLDIGLVAIGHALDEFLGAGKPRSLHSIGEREPGAARDDVVPDRAAEQEVLLQYDAVALAQVAQIDLAQIRAVQLQEAAVVAVDALEQARDGL